MNRVLVFTTLLLAACTRPAATSAQQAPPDPVGAAASTITATDALEHVQRLASDDLRGRNTPSPGLERAAAYIAGQFESFGLRPAGDAGTYFQRYPLPLLRVDSSAVRATLRSPAGARPLEYGRDFIVQPGSVPAAAGDLVLLGEAGRVALPPGSLDGRIAVLALPVMNWGRAAERAQRNATAAGAAAVVFIADSTVPREVFASFARNAGQARRVFGGASGIPALFLRADAAADLLASAGLDVATLRARPADAPPLPLPGFAISLQAPAEVLADDRPPNVVAVLPGSDPALRNEYVVLSAHFDHVGVGRPDAEGDSIYNGADDNASGTAALLELAEAFASLPEPPARSLLFLAVSGEEKGLLGSQYFTDHPTVPIDAIVANINIDMVGRNAPDTVVVIGLDYSSLGPLVQQIASRPELGIAVLADPWPEQRFFFRSDHFNFARREIPALFFFAGTHPDYHRPSDEPEKIDGAKIARVARLIFHTAGAVAGASERPRWTEEGLEVVRALTR